MNNALKGQKSIAQGNALGNNALPLFRAESAKVLKIKINRREEFFF